MSFGRAVFSHVYGYKRENKQAVIDEAEAKVVRRIFQMYADGISVTAIAHILNAERIPTKRNKHWDSTVFLQSWGMLRNPRYIGINIFKGGLEWNVTEDPAMRIVDRAIFDRVQRRLEAMIVLGP